MSKAAESKENKQELSCTSILPLNLVLSVSINVVAAATSPNQAIPKFPFSFSEIYISIRK